MEKFTEMALFPPLKTSRLILRAFQLNDTTDLHELLTDPKTNTFLPWFPSKTITETEQFIKDRFMQDEDNPQRFCVAVCNKNTNRVIGYVTVGDADSYDFGYAIQRSYQNQGLITEACEAIIPIIASSGTPYLTATHDINNPASGAVMKKLGFTYHYSYTELWMPKGYDVTFRMYQLNFTVHAKPYMGYWNQYPRHTVETL